MFVGVVQEIVKIAEGVEDGKQARQAQKADHEHAQELAQQIAVNDRHVAGWSAALAAWNMG
jgi:hypothetical protein